MNVRIAGMAKESIVDGPGVRLTIFTQGCLHNCKGCHNPETHAPDEGCLVTAESIIEECKNLCSLYSGVTFSGGEPFLQAESLSEIARYITGNTQLNIILYSGFIYENLLIMAEKDVNVRELLHSAWLLVDGPYIEELRDISLSFRGSNNQRIIDVQKSLQAQAVILWQESIR